MKPSPSTDSAAPKTPKWTAPCGAEFTDLAKMLAHASTCGKCKAQNK